MGKTKIFRFLVDWEMPELPQELKDMVSSLLGDCLALCHWVLNDLSTYCLSHKHYWTRQLFMQFGENCA